MSYGQRRERDFHAATHALDWHRAEQLALAALQDRDLTDTERDAWRERPAVVSCCPGCAIGRPCHRAQPCGSQPEALARSPTRTGGQWTRQGAPTRSTRRANASTAPQRRAPSAATRAAGGNQPE